MLVESYYAENLTFLNCGSVRRANCGRSGSWRSAGSVGGMKTRTIIVDDELLARERLRQLLDNEPEIEIVGECADGREAVAAICKQAPHLVFLDIQMPELDDFGVLEAIHTELTPVIVFVTAYDKYAQRLFEDHAVDYLLKPFDRERFQAVLQHARQQLRNREGNELTGRLSAMLTEWRSTPRVKHLSPENWPFVPELSHSVPQIYAH